MSAQSMTYRAAVDPVCGMTVDPGTSAGSSRVGGTEYFFCSTSCKARFDANPAQFVAKAEPQGGPSCHSHGCCGQ